MWDVDYLPAQENVVMCSYYSNCHKYFCIITCTNILPFQEQIPPADMEVSPPESDVMEITPTPDIYVC